MLSRCHRVTVNGTSTSVHYEPSVPGQFYLTGNRGTCLWALAPSANLEIRQSPRKEEVQAGTIVTFSIVAFVPYKSAKNTCLSELGQYFIRSRQLRQSLSSCPKP